MSQKLLPFMLLVSSLSATPPAPGYVGLQESQGAAAPPPRVIPGITAKDAFPRACVDCHINYPDLKLDAHLSTFMKQWNVKVEPSLLRKAAAAAPPGLTLQGQHPGVAGALRDIPAGCLVCHGKTSKMAPPFARMLHAIHLTGGKDNHFLTMFQGESTHCHKLNADTGAWSIPSGPEK